MSVTPISTVNETPAVPASFAEFESISSENTELPKPDPNDLADELSETDTEILTKLLMEQFNGLENNLNAAEIVNERCFSQSLYILIVIFSYGAITEPINVLPTSPSSENSGTNSIVAHGFPGIDFNVTPGSPVVLSEMELNHLPELSTTVEGMLLPR